MPSWFRSHSPRGLLALVLAAGLIGAAPAGWPSSPTGEEIRDPGALLFHGAGDAEKGSTEWPEAVPATSSGNVYLLVQFEGLATAEKLGVMRSAGLEPVRYVPNNAYIFRASGPELAEKGLGGTAVRRVLVPGPENRVSPEAASLAGTKAAGEPLPLAITFWLGEGAERAIARTEELGGRVLHDAPHPVQPMLFAELPAGAVSELALLPEIEWIEVVSELSTRNNTQGASVESGTATERPFRGMGLSGAGQVVGHLDSLLDAGSTFFVDPSEMPPGPGHRKLVRLAGAGNPATHGTHTAATIAGFRADGNPDNAGIAPLARLSHADYRTLIPLYDRDEPQNFTQLYMLLAQARADGARVHSNSWGDDERSHYTYLAAAADLFTFLHEDALVVFAATNTETLKSPENARNVLSVGSSRRFPNLQQRHRGGEGPTFDGRLKPDLYAPGEQVLSAFPGQNLMGTLSGTSMAAAVVSGAAALVREYFESGRHPSGVPTPGLAFSPSGALVKAVLVNGAWDLQEVEDYPSPRQGWGRLQLDRVLATGDRDFRRLHVEDFRASTGGGLRTTDTHRVPVLVTGRGEALRATLAWDDPPVSRASQTVVVNNLDLLVEGPDGVAYRGNYFEGRRSVTGGVADFLNNMEQVHLPGPSLGLHQVIVKAPFVEPLNAPQGFALAVSGDIRTFAHAPHLEFVPDDVPANRSAELYLILPGLGQPSVTIDLEGTSGDTETMRLFERVSGVYEATVPFATRAPNPGNGVLEGSSGETFKARYTPPGMEEPLEAEILLRAAGTSRPSWTLF